MTAIAPSTIHSTFVIERSFHQALARVYAAFAQPEQKRRWYVEGPHEILNFEMDFRIGGHERARYRFREDHQFAGVELESRTTFADIVPESRIVVTSTMTFGDRPISVVLITFEFLATDVGTDLICTHQGTFFEGSGGPEMRERGWQVLFDRLANVLA